MARTIALLLLALAVLGGRAEGPKAACQSPLGEWPRRVEGLGLDPKSAQAHAYRQAQEQIGAFLRRQQPPVKAWAPSEDYIRSHLLEKEEQGKDLPLEPGTAKSWIILLTPPQLEAFYRLDEEQKTHDREQRRQERALELGKVFGSSLALLAIWVVCGQLSGRTGGRLATLFCLLGLAVTGAIAAAMWYYLC